jgi:hypothetical protein
MTRFPLAAVVRLAASFAVAALVLGGSTAWAHPHRRSNPPGPRGGPGTNWQNPPGPRGGPGTSRFLRPGFRSNPPGRRGGPGTNWANPPGPVGGPGASPYRLRPYRPWRRW